MLLKFKVTNSLLAIALGLLTIGTVPAAYAQGWNDSAEPAPGQVRPMNPADVSDGDLDKFANVNVKAHEIQQKYEPQVDSAKTMDDIERIQAQMQGELIDVIHAEDISVDEYQQVATAVQQDPQLRKRFEAKVMEKFEEAD